MGNRLRKALAFWPVVTVMLAADMATKALAVERLSPPFVPHPVLGNWLRFTLAFNPGAAMGTSVGAYSRLFFGAAAAIAVVVLVAWYFRSPGDRLERVFALGLLTAGAAGNLVDRIVSARGVVDFIDIGVGTTRFWTFNVADMCITIGVVLFLFSSRPVSRDST